MFVYAPTIYLDASEHLKFMNAVLEDIESRGLYKAMMLQFFTTSFTFLTSYPYQGDFNGLIDISSDTRA